MKTVRSTVLLIGAAALVACCFADTDAGNTGLGGIGLKPFGEIGLLTTRVVDYKWFGTDQKPQFFNNMYVDLGFKAEFNAHTSILLCLENFLWFNSTPNQRLSPVQPGLIQSSAYPVEAELQIGFDKDNFFSVPENLFTATLHAGFFPYKYNPDARNLGEYLYRSGTYPGWLITKFDVSRAYLTGLMVETKAFNFWKNDLLVTTEMQMYPFYDLSYSWISGIDILKVLTIGGGVNLARFTPANAEYSARAKDAQGRRIEAADTAIASRMVNINGIDTIVFDTSYTQYTFKGIKLMGRFSFDFKALLPPSVAEIFGKEDGKLYGEVAVLGLEDQGRYYSELWRRIPVMGGFNVPTFKLLDVLSCEFEYYRFPYPNDFRNQISFMQNQNGGTPIPSNGIGINDASSGYYLGGANWRNYDTDSFKWSVYARRSIGTHFAIVAQAARDHWRTSSNSLQTIDYEEALTTPKHWYWAMKTVGMF